MPLQEERKKTKFAGREREINMVARVLEEVGEGRGRLLLIEGEAGIGKTRFVEEVLKLPRAEGFYKLTTRCVYFEEIDPYLPFKEIYLQYREILESWEGATGEEFFAPPAGAGGEAGEPAPLSLLPLMVEEDTAKEVKEETTPESRVKFLFDLERRGPVLLFVDDVHWIDRASLNLMKYLSTRVGNKRILIMATYRPEDLLMEREKTYHILETLKALGKERTTTRLVLERLNRGAVEEMIRDQLEVSELPHGLLDEIYRYSGGNPFFVEELLFSLINNGILYPGVVDDSAVARIREVEIPLTLSDLIARRYESLSDDARRVVRSAAVAGLEIELPLLQRVVEISGERLLDALEELQLTRFMEEDKREGEILYRFTNSIIQEYIYRNLSLSRRRYLHNRIGMAMEELYKNRPRYYNTIAMHFYNAENYSLAGKYYMMTADIIVKSNPLEAADYYEKALQIYRERGLGETYQYMRILMNLIDLYLEMGEAKRAEKAIAEAGRFIGSDSLGRDFSLRLNHRLGELYLLKNDLKKARGVMERLLQNREILSYPEEASRLFRNIGYVYWRLGLLEKAVEMYSLSLSRAKEDKQVRYVMKLYLDMGNIMSYKGEMSRARGYYLSGLRVITEHGNRFDEIRVHNNIADTYLREGRIEEALEESAKAVDLSRKYGFKVIWPYVTHLEALARAGEVSSFEEHLRVISKEIEDFDAESSPDVKYCRAVLFKTLAEREEDKEKEKELLEEAVALLKEADAAYRERGFNYERAVALAFLGEVLLEMGRDAEAKEFLQQAKEIFQKYNNDFMVKKVESLLKEETPVTE